MAPIERTVTLKPTNSTNLSPHPHRLPHGKKLTHVNQENAPEHLI